MDPLTYQKLLHEIEKVRGEQICAFNPYELPVTEISNKSSLVDIPLVSVLVITYNHENYIAQAIEGILGQTTSFPIELVIAEDCSTDRTREIVMNYQQNHPDIIRIITSDNNTGAKKNVQRALLYCRGKYLAFCEGDDYWHHPNKLQMQYDYLVKHPDCGLVSTDLDVYDQKRGIFGRNVLHKRNSAFDNNASSRATFLAILDKRFYQLTCTIMVVKRFFDQILVADEILHRSNRFLMGDTQKWAEMAMVSKIHYLDISTATYRLSPVSASRPRNTVRAAEFNLSSADLRVYLSTKYSLREELIHKYWETFLRYALWTGVLSQCPMMIKLAVSAMTNMSIKQRILSLGQKSWPVGQTVSFLAKVYALAKMLMTKPSPDRLLGHGD